MMLLARSREKQALVQSLGRLGEGWLGATTGKGCSFALGFGEYVVLAENADSQ